MGGGWCPKRSVGAAQSCIAYVILRESHLKSNILDVFLSPIEDLDLAVLQGEVLHSHLADLV